MFKTAIVMAGGEGNRLGPLTEKTPKPMLPVNGKPILEHIVRNLLGAGLQHIYLSVNYKADIIIEHFGDGRKFGISIEYLQEKEKLGTAGSLSLLPAIPDEPVLVMNGDVITSVDYSSFFAFHVKHRGVMTVAAMEYRVKVPFGTLQTANHFLLSVVEKPEVRFHCNAGVYALDPEALQYIPVNRAYDMTDLMSDLIHNGLPVSVFPIHECWMDIGRPEDLEKARAGINANSDRLGPER
jgi:NDP-sugar pyrophosphorylase family protein